MGEAHHDTGYEQAHMDGEAAANAEWEMALDPAATAPDRRGAVTGLFYRCPGCSATVDLEEYGDPARYCAECGRWMVRVRMSRCPGSGTRMFESSTCRSCGQLVGVDAEDRAIEHDHEIDRP